MSLRRYIAVLRKEGVRDEYLPMATRNIEVARRCFAELVEEKWPGWTIASVKPETDEHNIPKLDPIRWAEWEAKLADTNRRCGNPTR